MKNVKRSIETFSIFDKEGIKKHLQEMAMNGWLLESVNEFIWRYRRIEPAPYRFTVLYNLRATKDYYEPSEDEEKFYESCEKAGWKLATATSRIQIFYTEAGNSISIEPNPKRELEEFHRVAKRDLLYSNGIILLCCLLLVILFLARPIELFTNWMRIITIIVSVIISVVSLMSIISYSKWKHKAVRTVDSGGCPIVKGKFWSKKVLYYITLAGIICVILGIAESEFECMILLVDIFLMLVVRPVVDDFLEKRGAKKGRKYTVFALGTIACILLFIAMNWTPKEKKIEDSSQAFLVIEDLREIGEGEYTFEMKKEGTMFLEKTEVSQFPNPDDLAPYLMYEVVEVKNLVLYDWCRQELLKEKDRPREWRIGYEKVDAGQWGVEEAYRRKQMNTEYLLCYENYIVEICFNWEPTERQMKIVGEKFRAGQM